MINNFIGLVVLKNGSLQMKDDPSNILNNKVKGHRTVSNGEVTKAPQLNLNCLLGITA